MAKFTFTLAVLVFSLSSVVLGQGTQFITGACSSDADCASGCCGFRSGKCAGAIVAQERDGGCGFGDATPNDRAAVALGFMGAAPTGTSTNAGTNTGNSGSCSDPSASAAAAAPAAANPSASAAASSSGSSTSGSGNGAQFITGPCSSDADCASGCCGFNSGKCAGPVIAQERDGGCGFGDGQPNDNAAQAFRASQKRWAEYDYWGEY